MRPCSYSCSSTKERPRARRRGAAPGRRATGSPGSGQERRLGSVSSAALLPSEVRARGLEDAVRAVPEVDRVEVGGEDPVLRPPLGQLPGERGLAHLAGDRLLVPAVGVLDVLLRDRRAALDDALAADVLPERAHDAAQVDTVVLVEALVLDGDDRLLHDRRDRLRRDEHAALVATEDREHRGCPEAFGAE